jgi:hypothetical protein
LPGVFNLTERGKGAQFGLIEDEDSGNERECLSPHLLRLLLKKEIYWSIFTDVSMSGTFPEIGNTAPVAGCTSMYTLEPAVIGFTRNVI